jgi:translocation and assembly module TamB
VRRRTLVLLVSIATLLGIVVIAVLSVGIGVNTTAGRDQIRLVIQQRLARGLNGKVYVGKVSGSLLTSVSIDSFAIRGLDDSLYVSAGKITAEYNPADFIDGRILIKNITIDHPVMRIEKLPNGDWSDRVILRKPPSNRPKVPGRSLGEFIVLDSVTIRNGMFSMTRGWTPPDSLTGPRRDSAIRVALADTTREFRNTATGVKHTQRWKNINGFLPHVRFNHPDSQSLGREFIFERVSVEEVEPPFKFSNARGVARHQGDSVFFDISHFDLPASTGSAVGKIYWGGGLPDRWDVRVRGDSVALNDVHWVYATLPRTGSGSTNIHIRNSIDNLAAMEYALTDLDVRSEKSRMSGAMTFVVGNPVLGIKDVNLRFSPLNFDMVRTLAGGPFPVDWQGDLIGMAQGPGGPLTNFVLDTMNITWRDTHVKGAVTRFAGKGELDILRPDSTRFHGFEVASDLIDVRSIQYLFSGFPRIGGTISGSATLDSSWLDVRFSNADISHSNGPETPSRVTGKGRITYGVKYMRFDVDIDAKPISMPMMSRAYDLGLTGYFSGPIKARGISPNLRVIADLKGAGGRFTYDGVVDADVPTYGYKGAGRVETLQLGEVIAGYSAPAAWITGDYLLDFSADTTGLATSKGTAKMSLERSEVGDVRVFPSRIVARFDDRKVFFDTLRIESTAATLDATGGLGLAADRADSIAYTIQVDSLGGLRRYAQMLLTPRADGAPPDSLAGTLTLRGWMQGNVPSFRLAGTMQGSDVVLRRDIGHELAGQYDIANPFTAPTGSLSLRSKTLKLGRVAFDTVGVALRLNEGRTGAFSVGARETNGATISTQGEFAREDSVTLLSLKSLAFVTDDSRWLMSGSTSVRLEGKNVDVDSLVLLNDHGGRVALTASVPDSGRARMVLRADSLPLRDVGVLSQIKRPLAGWANFTVTGAGSSDAPVINADARFSAITFDSLHLDSGTGRVEYAANRANVQLDLTRGKSSVLQFQGSLPIALQYFGAELLDDPLQASIRTEGAQLDLVQALVPGMRDAKGKLLAIVDVGGTWKHPDVTGSVNVINGEATIEQLGIRLKGIHVDLGLFGHADSLAIRRFVAWSGTGPADSVSLSGYVGYGQFSDPLLNLRLDARQFYAIDKRALARLYISTERGGLTLRGVLSAATLAGGVLVNRGTVYLPDPELSRKQTVEFRSQFADTATQSRIVLLDTRSKLLESIALDGVRVTLGEDVSLTSPDADIRLTGSLSVRTVATRIPSQTIGGADTLKYEPVFDGILRADRGTYTLKLLETFRRPFAVQQGGTIVFYPSADLPQELNITAVYAVKRANQADIRIRVHLTGPVSAPIVALESGESYPLSQTDMVSYLVFGVPSFALGDRETSTLQLALQNVIPTLQAALSSQLGRRFGNFNLSVTPGTVDYDNKNASTGDQLGYLLATTRVGGEVQFSDNVFASVSTGLCQLPGAGNGSGSGNDIDITKGLSANLEYRFNPTTSVKAGRVPDASALNCGKSVTGRAFIPTPSQWGFSLFKSWRF